MFGSWVLLVASQASLVGFVCTTTRGDGLGQLPLKSFHALRVREIPTSRRLFTLLLRHFREFNVHRSSPSSSDSADGPPLPTGTTFLLTPSVLGPTSCNSARRGALKMNERPSLRASYSRRSLHRRSVSLSLHTSAMDPESLMRINAHEERLFPVELKVRMLMEQASMRMRASAMVGERIALLDDVIRVRALLAIVRQKKNDGDEASKDATKKRSSSSSCESYAAEKCPPSTRTPPTEEEYMMYTRMAVSALKTVLFQVVDEGASDSSKDLSQVYDGLVSTDDLAVTASEGFPTLDVDSLLSREQARYRKVVTARHRFLLRKLGVLLDMDEGLEKLLALADADEEETVDDANLTDVPLQSASPEKSESPPSLLVEKARDHGAGSGLVGSGAPVKAIATLRDSSWDIAGPGSEDTTEGETDEEASAHEFNEEEACPV